MMGTMEISLLSNAHEDQQARRDASRGRSGAPLKDLANIWKVHFQAVLVLVSLDIHIVELAGLPELLDCCKS